MGRHARTDDDNAASPPPTLTDATPAVSSPPVAEDTSATGGGGPRPQPVLTAAAIQTVLAAAVTVGWVQLDDVTLSTIATIIAAVIAAATAFIARGKVTPTAAPRDNSGRPLGPPESQ